MSRMVCNKPYFMKQIIIVILFLSHGYYSFSQYTLPILDLNTNARLGGFGEVGVVSSRFYKNTGVYQNPALISNNSRNAGVDLFYSPEFGTLNDYGVAGFFAVDSSNAIGVNFSYFDYGNITLTDETGQLSDRVNPYDLYFKVAYNHAFSKLISTGIALKYLRSNMYSVNYTNEKTVNSIALDVGFNYNKTYSLNNNSFLNTSAGLAINNFGPRVSYANNSKKEFIPTKLSVGVFINPDIGIKQKLRLNIELGYQAEKYLVPTPPIYDLDGNIVEGYNPDISSFKALYQSFYDAPGGFEEEIDEIRHKFGSEFRISYSDFLYFAFRHGRSIENELKGDRNYQTFGYGVGIYGFTFDYMNIRPGDNTTIDNNWLLTLGYTINIDKGIFKF